MKKRIWIIALIFGLVLSLTACGGGNKANNSKGAEGNTEAKGNFEPGREDGELDVCIASEPESIDPALNTTVDGATMIQHLSEGLIKWDHDGKSIINPRQIEIINEVFAPKEKDIEKERIL